MQSTSSRPTSNGQRPTCPPPILDTIPASMKAERRWCCWRYEWKTKEKTWAKVPIDTTTNKWQKWKDRTTWLTFDDAAAAFQRGKFSGVGFFLGDGWAGIDFDDHLDPVTKEPDYFAKLILGRLNSRSDISPSGQGIKMIVRATIQKGHVDHEAGIEIYGSGRFFTVTGHRLKEYPADVEHRQEELTKLLSELSPPKTPHHPGGQSDRETAIAALPALSSARCDGYLDWLNVGQSLHSVDSSLLPEWDSWSRGSAKYAEGVCAEKWASFNGHGGLTLASLCYWADEDSPGWRENCRRNGTSQKHHPGTSSTATDNAEHDGGDAPHYEWEPSVLPEVLLPGGTVTITNAAMRFGDLLAATGRIFRRGASVSNLAHDQDGQPVLHIVKPAGFASLLEGVARLRTIKKTKDGYEKVPTICYEPGENSFSVRASFSAGCRRSMCSRLVPY